MARIIECHLSSGWPSAEMDVFHWLCSSLPWRSGSPWRFLSHTKTQNLQTELPCWLSHRVLTSPSPLLTSPCQGSTNRGLCWVPSRWLACIADGWGRRWGDSRRKMFWRRWPGSRMYRGRWGAAPRWSPAVPLWRRVSNRSRRQLCSRQELWLSSAPALICLSSWGGAGWFWRCPCLGPCWGWRRIG